uniref:Putative secreted peptide n=1 Tax=Anopheles braziliensis TaxID=58242 RepID=A0A2M3ZRY6_9DIPT
MTLALASLLLDEVLLVEADPAPVADAGDVSVSRDAPPLVVRVDDEGLAATSDELSPVTNGSSPVSSPVFDDTNCCFDFCRLKDARVLDDVLLPLVVAPVLAMLLLLPPCTLAMVPLRLDVGVVGADALPLPLVPPAAVSARVNVLPVVPFPAVLGEMAELVEVDVVAVRLLLLPLLALPSRNGVGESDVKDLAFFSLVAILGTKRTGRSNCQQPPWICRPRRLLSV